MRPDTAPEGSTARRILGSRAKRAIDLLVAATCLLVAAPVLLLGAAGVLIEDGRPVLFTQERIGVGGRRFRLLKLRSMRLNETSPDQLGQVTPGHHLVTRVGALLRRTKIDELPQLWNVLVGDMSLVGPRPTIREQVDRYGPFERRRLEARPGLSGWAQVNGNTELSWQERIALDVWYIDNWSPWLDARILARTVAVVIRGETVDPSALEEAKRHANRTSRRG